VREAGDLIDFVDRLKTADPLAVSEQPSRLRYR
jgi:hypothetical protein